MNRPQRGIVYTLAEVLCDLELRDSACLCFYVQDLCYPDNRSSTEQVIDYAHLTDDQFLSLPGWGETEWTFAYETNEWVPVFRAVDDRSIERLCHIEPYVDRDLHGMNHMWVIPRGFDRPQQPVAYNPEIHGKLEVR